MGFYALRLQVQSDGKRIIVDRVSFVLLRQVRILSQAMSIDVQRVGTNSKILRILYNSRRYDID